MKREGKLRSRGASC
ncbi:hypothetical protein TSAR_004710 [Trichomalopsis sarcophagae]|uniref:Uncharacterized protein n=1 Tax=Trichomalopsis sarcophagae TaxID=543379 RepID=A0A232FL95_9HYME|nr:hypothetical protein TSAR_004710 [Trichomalopsis sarcophagae]